MDFLFGNWGNLLAIVGAVIAGASVVLNVIAPLTATRKDDNLLAALQWILAKLALNKKL